MARLGQLNQEEVVKKPETRARGEGEMLSLNSGPED